MALSRDDILKATDIVTETVDCPEWGDSVIVRSLTGSERDAFEASMTMQRPAAYGPKKGQLETVPDPTNARAKLVVRGCIDMDGNRLFTDADIRALGDKNATVLDRLFDRIAALSGMSPNARADAEENSAAGPTGDSPSVSPATSTAP